ncbi:hypothetical protein RAS1_22990 [Phycisphaerae bacterium RAS1]|nr:hypothetical protein RAS1_22990 [Phycisphaerae bacterium RAS1]
MARRSRSHSRHERTRGGRGQRGRPPGLRTLFAWLIPFAAISGLADWMVSAQILEHYRKHGHVCLPGIGLAAAFSFTGTTISVPFFWLQARRQARKSR